MKKIAEENIISLKDLAKLSEPTDWQKEYAAIRQRAKRGKYNTYKKIKGEGYISVNDSAIPETLRNVILQKNIQHQEDIQIGRAGQRLDQENELSPEDEKLAVAKANVIKMYLEYLAKHGKDKETRKKFVVLYNHKAFHEQFEQTGELGSWKTIEKWKVEYINANYDYRVLAPKYKPRSSSVPPEQSEILIKLALNPNQPLISELVRMAMDIFEMKRHPRILSDHTYRRFIENWKKEHYADWVFFREGEHALDNNILPSLERDYDKIEVGDILVMDGHVNNFETINPFTGKPKRMMTVAALDMKSEYLCGYEISPTENTFAIAVAIYRAIRQLGKIPKIIYIDNGRAFGAKYFHGDDLSNIEALFARLGIKVIFATAYHAQSKLIEPFWRWLAELERLVPTYVGTSIAMQPPRLNRGEKLHVKLYEKMMHGTTVDIFTTHKAMAWWLDKYHSRVKTSGHLKGLCPAEVFNSGKGTGIDKRELTFLMMQHEIRTVYQNGIKMFNTSYWHENLFGKQWDEVLVRYDLLDNDSIFVYDNNGEFICEARRIDKVHPAAGILGTEEDVKLLHAQLERKASLKKMIVGEAKQFLQNEIYPAVKKQFEVNILELNNEEPKLLEDNLPGQPAPKKRKSIIDRWNEANIGTKKRIAEG
ncbi:MAG: Mu transposase C-terminal domain-containing protein [Ignavibacteriales bacterium]|nr:Mu transposase C-terminal domain-containing protein [Ignavibacteriales bacterium]